MQQNDQEINIKEAFKALFQLLGEEYNWQWEERKGAWLSEFSRDKIDKTLEVLNEHFDDAWHYKNIKKAPTELKTQLNDLAKLNKEQKLFSTPSHEDKPTLLAIWWPWGHGATVSLRLMTLENSYTTPVEKPSKDSFFTVVKKLFSN